METSRFSDSVLLDLLGKGLAPTPTLQLADLESFDVLLNLAPVKIENIDMDPVGMIDSEIYGGIQIVDKTGQYPIRVNERIMTAKIPNLKVFPWNGTNVTLPLTGRSQMYIVAEWAYCNHISSCNFDDLVAVWQSAELEIPQLKYMLQKSCIVPILVERIQGGLDEASLILFHDLLGKCEQVPTHAILKAFLVKSLIYVSNTQAYGLTHRICNNITSISFDKV